MEKESESAQIGRWFDGLGNHVISTKGHDKVHTWSDVITLKLSSLCPCQGSITKQEEFYFWVSPVFPRPT